MTEPSTAPVPDKGLIARAIGIVTAPGETFRSVVKEPRPALMLLLVCAVIALATALPQFTERGRLAALEMQVQQTERFMTVTPEAYRVWSGTATTAATSPWPPRSSSCRSPRCSSARSTGRVFNAILGGTADVQTGARHRRHTRRSSAALGARRLRRRFSWPGAHEHRRTVQPRRAGRRCSSRAAPWRTSWARSASFDSGQVIVTASASASSTAVKPRASRSAPGHHRDCFAGGLALAFSSSRAGNR